MNLRSLIVLFSPIKSTSYILWNFYFIEVFCTVMQFCILLSNTILSNKHYLVCWVRGTTQLLGHVLYNEELSTSAEPFKASFIIVWLFLFFLM